MSNLTIHDFVPGGAHTYSRGDDQYPYNAPALLERGKGCHVYDKSGQEWLDFGMGLRSVNIGYADDEINAGALDAINKGNNLSRASELELEAAKAFVGIIPGADMVKFAKNGSNVTTAAIKLARAYTRKTKVLYCNQHPFFSFDDWFIGKTAITRGVPDAHASYSIGFDYNDIDGLRALMTEHSDIAALIMEPAASKCPNFNRSECCGKIDCAWKEGNYLQEVRDLCDEFNIVMILDEMITGFRWDLSGAQKFYNVVPDLSTFGKAMANGFSLAALAGKREIMNLGSILTEGEERTFLLSSTHGAEMSSLGAFLACIDKIKRDNIIETNWSTGQRVKALFNTAYDKVGLSKQFQINGPGCSPILAITDENGVPCPKRRTLFLELMADEHILMPYISISYAHSNIDFNTLEKTCGKVAAKISTILRQGNLDESIRGHLVKPVFRRFN